MAVEQISSETKPVSAFNTPGPLVLTFLGMAMAIATACGGATFTSDEHKPDSGPSMGGSGTGGGAGVGGTTGSGGSAGSAGGSSGANTGGRSGGSGGATGGGGSTGGSTNTGGASGSGGAMNTGGKPGSGGIASTGGVTGMGGITSTGGITNTGGGMGSGGITNTGGGMGSGGGGGVITQCPPSSPDPTSHCQDGLQCSYGSDSRVSCRPLYTCNNGVWDVSSSACKPVPSCLSLPTAPQVGAACPTPNQYCEFDMNLTCQCVPCTSTTCSASYEWTCTPPPSTPCPAVPPNLGQPCSVQTAQSCAYAFCGAPEYVVALCSASSGPDLTWTWEMPPCAVIGL